MVGPGAYENTVLGTFNAARYDDSCAKADGARQCTSLMPETFPRQVSRSPVPPKTCSLEQEVALKPPHTLPSI